MTGPSSSRTVAEHPHRFADADWPFAETSNTAAFATVAVLSGALPMLEVYHDHDGDWQFLCGTTTATEDLRLVCMGCAYEREPGLRELGDLPVGWMAWRESVDAPWRRSAYDEDDEG